MLCAKTSSLGQTCYECIIDLWMGYSNEHPHLSAIHFSSPPHDATTNRWMQGRELEHPWPSAIGQIMMASYLNGILFHRDIIRYHSPGMPAQTPRQETQKNNIVPQHKNYPAGLTHYCTIDTLDRGWSRSAGEPQQSATGLCDRDSRQHIPRTQRDERWRESQESISDPDVDWQRKW
jgi:hypothetical protein